MKEETLQDGLECKVETFSNVRGLHYAMVKVGGVVKVTDDFESQLEALTAGQSLVADTLAFILDGE